MLGLVHLCNIKRSVAVGTNGRTQEQTLYSNVACLVLPMNNTTAIENQFSLGRAFDFYFDVGQDVKPSDQLIYNGNTHAVKSVQSYDEPLVGHVRALCEQVVS